MARDDAKRFARPELNPRAFAALRDCLKSGHWRYGSEARKTEEAVAAVVGVDPRCVVLTKSCTVAIAAAAQFLPVYSCATAPVLTYPGTYSWSEERELSDCDADGWPIEDVAVSVDLWGRAAPARGIIHDAAHRFPFSGIEWSDPTQAVCVSFGPTKEICAPLGGALIARDKELAEDAGAYLNNGIGKNSFGTKGLCPDPIAAIIRQQIAEATALARSRQSVLSGYASGMDGSLLTLPGESSAHLAIFKAPSVEAKARIVAKLDEHEIEHSLHYPVPDHYDVYKTLVSKIISLPCHHRMRAEDARHIAQLVLSA